MKPQPTVLLLVMLSAMLPLLPLHAQETTARGTVFDDANRNGVRDAGEAGISGVGVSNGKEVVLTGAAGGYELPVGDDTILFVIKPRDWMTPLDENNLPRFYYIHKPAGSPELKYAGVKPTGPLPDSVDFPLVKREEGEEFEVVVFGDTQPRNLDEVEYIAHDVVKELLGVDAAFGVTLGDVVFDDLSIFEPLNEVIGRIGIPWYNVHGNHDTNQDVSDDAISDETFEAIYGPPHYAFTYGPVHFIILDNIAWEGGGYHGEVGEHQLEFVRNDLAHVPAHVPVVVMMHIPLFETVDKVELLEILSQREHALSIAAHWHTQMHFFYGEDDGFAHAREHHHWVAATVCGSWWAGMPDERGIPHATMSDGVPNGYSFLELSADDYRIRFKAAGRPADYQMNIYAPEEVAADAEQTADVLVNLFTGTERSEVQTRVAESEWKDMERVEIQDPSYVAKKKMEDEMVSPRARNRPFRSLPDPSDSTHMWKAPLPAGLAPGTHVIEVRSKDPYHVPCSGMRLIRVK